MSRLKWLREFEEECSARKPYTDGERWALVNEIDRRRAQEGRNAQELSAELGISTWSYYNWKRRLAIEVAPVLRPVAIVESFTPQSPVPQPVLVSPSGYRVEGLTVEGVAQLLRQLA